MKVPYSFSMEANTSVTNLLTVPQDAAHSLLINKQQNYGPETESVDKDQKQ